MRLNLQSLTRCSYTRVAGDRIADILAYSSSKWQGLAACREHYLETTLQSLARLRGLQEITLYVSQDGQHQGVRSLVERIAAESFRSPAVRHFEHWEHRRMPLLGNGQV